MKCDQCDYAMHCDDKIDVWTYISVFLAGAGFLASVIAVTIFLGVQI